MPYNLGVGSGGAVSSPILFPDGTVGAPSIAWASDADGSGTGFYRPTANRLSFTANGAEYVRFAALEILLSSAQNFGWSSNVTPSSGAMDVFLGREGGAILQQGQDVNGTAIHQTFKAGDAITSADVAGGNFTFASGRGMGTGAVSSLIFQTPTVAAAGANAQSLATRLTINSAGAVFAADVQINDSQQFKTASRGFLTFSSDGTLRLSNAAGTAFNLLQFGGTSNSFAALRRNGAAIDVRLADDSTGAIFAEGYGGNVASNTALVPVGNTFHVTGTTTITSITSTGIPAGTVLRLIFDGILTFTDGNNLKLAGNFVTTADDTISLVFDGTNFYELSRSVN